MISTEERKKFNLPDTIRTEFSDEIEKLLDSGGISNGNDWRIFLLLTNKITALEAKIDYLQLKLEKKGL